MNNITYELIDKIPNVDDNENIKYIKTYKDVLDYFGLPSVKLTTVEDYYNHLDDEIDICIAWENSQRHNGDSDNNKEIKLDKRSLNRLKLFKGLIRRKVYNDIKQVYVVIEYPLTSSAIIRFDIDGDVTFGLLLCLYSYAYQLIYHIEDNDISFQKKNKVNNTQDSITIGRFGIYDHDIDELVYNGASEIDIYEENNPENQTVKNRFVVCRFDCDS